MDEAHLIVEWQVLYLFNDNNNNNIFILYSTE